MRPYARPWMGEAPAGRPHIGAWDSGPGLVTLSRSRWRLMIGFANGTRSIVHSESACDTEMSVY